MPSCAKMGVAALSLLIVGGLGVDTYRRYGITTKMRNHVQCIDYPVRNMRIYTTQIDRDVYTFYDIGKDDTPDAICKKDLFLGIVECERIAGGQSISFSKQVASITDLEPDSPKNGLYKKYFTETKTQFQDPLK